MEELSELLLLWSRRRKFHQVKFTKERKQKKEEEEEEEIDIFQTEERSQRHFLKQLGYKSRTNTDST